MLLYLICALICLFGLMGDFVYRCCKFKEAKSYLESGIIAVFISLLTVFSVKLPIVLYNTISLVGILLPNFYDYYRSFWHL